MPPRFAYWTILVGGLPTAFRAAEREEIEPTFRRLQQKHPDAEMRWFARGKLWASPAEATAAVRQRSADADRQSRDRTWRPGGTHRDPRQPYKDAKKRDNQKRRERRFEFKQGSRPQAPGPRPAWKPNPEWKPKPKPWRAPESGARSPESRDQRPLPKGPRPQAPGARPAWKPNPEWKPKPKPWRAPESGARSPESRDQRPLPKGPRPQAPGARPENARPKWNRPRAENESRGGKPEWKPKTDDRRPKTWERPGPKWGKPPGKPRPATGAWSPESRDRRPPKTGDWRPPKTDDRRPKTGPGTGPGPGQGRGRWSGPRKGPGKAPPRGPKR